MDKFPSIQSKSKEEYLILLEWSKFHISVENFKQIHTGILTFFGASGLEELSLLIIKNARNGRVINNDNRTITVKYALVTIFYNMKAN